MLAGLYDALMSRLNSQFQCVCVCGGVCVY